MADEITADKPDDTSKLPKVEPIKSTGSAPASGPVDNGWRPPVSFAEPEPRPVPETPAAERLAAAHEKLLGKDVPLHDGKPEKGAGSKYAALHPAHKAHIAAIEHLVEVEAEHAAAEAHLSAVHARVERAIARVAATEEASAAVEEKV